MADRQTDSWRLFTGSHINTHMASQFAALARLVLAFGRGRAAETNRPPHPFPSSAAIVV